MYKTSSGAVKLQVLVTPNEYRDIRRIAKVMGFSISAVLRALLHTSKAAGANFFDSLPEGKYQPRGFARKRS